MCIWTESAQSRACHFHPLSDGTHRRSGQWSQQFLQMTSLHACWRVGLLIQQHLVLATLPPCLLPPTLLHPGRQRCPVFVWTPHQIPHCDWPCHLGSKHLPSPLNYAPSFPILTRPIFGLCGFTYFALLINISLFNVDVIGCHALNVIATAYFVVVWPRLRLCMT